MALFDVRAENPIAGVAPVLVAPQVAHVDGSYASQWRTTLSLFNPNVFPVRVTLELLASGRANPETAAAEVGMAPREWLEVQDVLALPAFAGGARTGALLLRAVASGARQAVSAPLAATARTFDLRSSGPDGAPGETLPTVPLAGGLCMGSTGTFRGVATDRVRRANLGVVALADAPVRVRVVLRNRGGTILEESEWEVPEFGHLQNRLRDGLDGGTVVTEVVAGPATARVFAYLSRIDRDSGVVINTLPQVGGVCAAEAHPPLPRRAQGRT